MDDNSKVFKVDSQAVQAHLNMLQSVIQRMAENSASAKSWCIALVSAILVVVADTGKSQYALITFIPTLLFLFLDAYYLSLEKGFRNSYNDFIKKLHSNQLDSHEMFLIKPKGKQTSLFIQSLRSPSIWPFYVSLIAMIIVSKFLIV